jgi:hypothetical protein
VATVGFGQGGGVSLPTDSIGSQRANPVGARSWLLAPTVSGWNWHLTARQGPRARNGNSSTPPVRRKASR